jgi:hypothetical protein
MKGVDADAAAATDREQYTHTREIAASHLVGELVPWLQINTLSRLSLFLLASALHLAVLEYYLDFAKGREFSIKKMTIIYSDLQLF